MSEELLEMKLKVKDTLEQVKKAQKGGRGIALLFLKHGIRGGIDGQGHVPTALPPVKRSGTYFTGGLCGTRGRSGFHPRTIQTVTSRYTDYAIAVSGLLELGNE